MAAGGINVDIHGRVHRGVTHLISFPDLSDGGIPREYCLASQGILRKPRSGGGAREYCLASQGILRKTRLGEAELKSVLGQNQVLTKHQDKTAM